MKNSIKTLAILALTLGAFKASAADKPTPGAVTCSKCETVWVSVPVFNASGKGFTTYRSAKKIECDDCESAVATFFKTGKMQHECKKCGGELKHCEEHKS